MEKKIVKVTKKQRFEQIANLLKDNAEIVEFCNHEIELLEKKRTNGNKKGNETAEKNVELVYQVLATIERATATELIATNELNALANENGIVTTQKVSAYLNKLVESGRVKKITDKKKTYFFVAEIEE